MRTSLLLSVLPLLAPGVSIPQTLREAETRQLCATDSELVVGALSLQDTPASVRRKLGNPRNRASGASEDDGGVYATVTYSYENLEVVFGRSGIERIGTTSPLVKAARGVTVGMTEAQVGERLGFLPGTDQGPFEVRLRACRPPGLAELSLVFAPRTVVGAATTAVLVGVSVTNFGP